MEDRRSRLQQLVDAAGRQEPALTPREGAEPEEPDGFVRFRLLDTPEALDGAAWWVERGAQVQVEERKGSIRIIEPESYVELEDPGGGPPQRVEVEWERHWWVEEDPPTQVTWLYVPRRLAREAMRTTRARMESQGGGGGAA
jgi:hypothetical protein